MPEPELIQRQTSLSANVVAFCRFLRQKGFTVGPQEEADALHSLLVLVPFDRPDRLQLCLKAVLARTLPQLHTFDELYQQYWRELDKAVNSKVKDGPSASGRNPDKGQQQATLQNIKNWLHGNTAEEEAEMATYSTHETLGRKDFSLLAEDELQEVAQLIHRIARSLALRESRRRKRARRAVQLDLRRTLRQNMRRGGELLELAHHKPARHRQKIVLLCDVSKSMDLYSRFLLQFVFTFQQASRRIEAFAFSTQLYRITGALRQRDFKTALSELTISVPGWSGGTRIGECFQEFIRMHAGRLLSKQTVVIVLSDGWDTGETEVLQESMRRIQRRSGKVIWLNPLAGSEAYEPETKGMQVAWPFIDVFAPGHNVESLRKLYQMIR